MGEMKKHPGSLGLDSDGPISLDECIICHVQVGSSSKAHGPKPLADVTLPEVQAYIFENVLRVKEYIREAFTFSGVDPTRFFRLCGTCSFLIHLGTGKNGLAITKHLHDVNRKVFVISRGTPPIASSSSSVPVYETLIATQDSSVVEMDLLRRLGHLHEQQDRELVDVAQEKMDQSGSLPVSVQLNKLRTRAKKEDVSGDTPPLLNKRGKRPGQSRANKVTPVVPKKISGNSASPNKRGKRRGPASARRSSAKPNKLPTVEQNEAEDVSLPNEREMMPPPPPTSSKTARRKIIRAVRTKEAEDFPLSNERESMPPPTSSKAARRKRLSAVGKKEEVPENAALPNTGRSMPPPPPTSSTAAGRKRKAVGWTNENSSNNQAGPEVSGDLRRSTRKPNALVKYAEANQVWKSTAPKTRGYTQRLAEVSVQRAAAFARSKRSESAVRTVPLQEQLQNRKRSIYGGFIAELDIYGPMILNTEKCFNLEGISEEAKEKLMESPGQYLLSSGKEDGQRTVKTAHECPLCAKCFASEMFVAYHIDRVHFGVSKPCMCPVCRSLITTLKSAVDHVKTCIRSPKEKPNVAGRVAAARAATEGGEGSGNQNGYSCHKCRAFLTSPAEIAQHLAGIVAGRECPRAGRARATQLLLQESGQSNVSEDPDKNTPIKTGRGRKRRIEVLVDEEEHEEASVPAVNPADEEAEDFPIEGDMDSTENADDSLEDCSVNSVPETVNEDSDSSEGSEDEGPEIIQVDGAQPNEEAQSSEGQASSSNPSEGQNEEPDPLQVPDDDEYRGTLCEVCGATFGDNLHLMYHRYAIHWKRVRIDFPLCRECRYVCMDQESLRAHMVEFHPYEVLVKFGMI